MAWVVPVALVAVAAKVFAVVVVEPALVLLLFQDRYCLRYFEAAADPVQAFEGMF